LEKKNGAIAIASRSAKSGLLIGLAVAAGFLVIWATAVGPGTEQDSSTYVCAAQSLISEGALYNCGSKWPMNHFPPLYPMMLGVGGLFGVAPLTFARWIGAISCAASVILTGTILYAATASLFIASIGELSIICVGDVAFRYLFAMTEGPFIAFMLLFIFSLWRSVDEDGSVWLVVAGGAAAAACLTRYMGASFLVTGATVLLYLGTNPIKMRIRRAVTFVAIGGSLLAVWQIRNHIETRNATDRVFGWHPLGLSELALGCTTVARWVYPPISRQRAPWIGLILIIVGVVILAAILWNNPGPLEWLLSNLIFANGALILLSGCLFDPLVRPHERMMGPILLSTFILSLCVISVNTRHTRPRMAWYSIEIALILAFLFVNGRATGPILFESRVRGLGGTERYYADSDVIRWLRHLPANVPVYSDEPEEIRLFADHSADTLPLLRDPLTRRPAKNFQRNLAAMQHALSDRPGAIVYFFKLNHWAQGNLPELTNMASVYHLSMKPVLLADQGIIYEGRYAPIP
jgi:hypothetical protein